MMAGKGNRVLEKGLEMDPFVMPGSRLGNQVKHHSEGGFISAA